MRRRKRRSSTDGGAMLPVCVFSGRGQTSAKARWGRSVASREPSALLSKAVIPPAPSPCCLVSRRSRRVQRDRAGAAVWHGLMSKLLAATLLNNVTPLGRARPRAVAPWSRHLPNAQLGDEPGGPPELFRDRAPLQPTAARGQDRSVPAAFRVFSAPGQLAFEQPARKPQRCVVLDPRPGPERDGLQEGCQPCRVIPTASAIMRQLTKGHKARD